MSSPVLVVPICEAFHLKERKPINLVNENFKSLSFVLVKQGKETKRDLGQLGGGIKVKLIANQPHQLL